MTTTATAPALPLASAPLPRPERAPRPQHDVPIGRDRVIDLVRASALVAVAAGHWLMAAVEVGPDGRLGGANLLSEVPATRWLTWVLQVIPLVFVAGGVAGIASLTSSRARGERDGAWVAGRLRRLLGPTAALIAVWSLVGPLGRLLGADPMVLELAGRVVGIPLWFLAVYAPVTALTPLAVAAHRRWGLRAPAALAAGVAAVDVVRFGFGIEAVAPLTMLLAWPAAHQLGIAWGAGALHARRVAAGGWLVGGGAAALALLCGPLGYPIAMVGGPGNGASNSAPPTLALVALGAVHVGLLLLAHPWLSRRLERPAAARAVDAAGRLAMGSYLWHMTALAIVAGGLVATGMFPAADVGSAAFWALRLPWIAVLAATLVPLLRLATALDRRVRTGPPGGRPDGSWLRNTAAVALASVGLASSALHGLAPATTPLGIPVVPLVTVVTAAALVGCRISRRA